MPQSHPAILHDGFIVENPEHPFSHTGAIVQRSDGAFLAAWVGGPANRDPQNKIWLATRGAGMSAIANGWLSPHVVASAEVACFNPVFWRTGGAEIFLNYKRGTSPENWSGVLLWSQDDGKMFGTLAFLPAGLTGSVRSKPFDLGNGVLLCGDSVEAYQAWSCWINETRDNGKTWTRRGPITLPDTAYGIIQPVLYWGDHEGKTIKLLARGSTPVGCLCEAVSNDGGVSWSAARRVSALPNPNSAIDIQSLPDGRIALFHNDHATSKSVLSVSISADRGQTWKRSLDFARDENGECLYPYAVLDRDELIHVVYTWNKKKIGYVVMDPAKI